MLANICQRGFGLKPGDGLKPNTVKRLRKIFRKSGLNIDPTLPLNSQTRYRNAV